MNNVYAIIISYNPTEELYSSVESLKKQVKKIIIVDNGSKDYSIIDDILNKYTDNIHIIKNDTNLGIATALNQGIEFSIKQNAEWILTLDQDSIPTEDMISKMIQGYSSLSNDKKAQVGIIVPKCIEKRYYDKEVKNEEKITDELIVITSGNLVKASVFNKVGLLEEKLFIDFVDHEFCIRINREGFKIIKVHNAILLHSLGESIKYNVLGKDFTVTNHSAIRRYYMTRNRMYLWNKYKENYKEWVAEDKKRFINESIKIIALEKNKFAKFKMIKKGIRDYKNNNYGKIDI